MEITQHATYVRARVSVCASSLTSCETDMHILRQGSLRLQAYYAATGADLVLASCQDAVKRTAVGIWHCRGCNKTIAGGAWTVSTTAATTVRSYVHL